MSGSVRIVRWLGIVLLVWSACGPLGAAPAPESAKARAALDHVVPELVFQAQPVEDVTKKLNALSGVPIHAAIAGTQAQCRITLDLRGAKVREILDAVAKQWGGSWATDEDAINLTSLDRAGRQTSLEAEFPTFEVAGKTKIDAAMDALFRPKFRAGKLPISVMGSFNARERGVTLRLERCTARQALNRITEENGHCYWLVVGNGTNHYFDLRIR